MSAQPNPERIMQVGLGFWASKTLLSGIEMGVFTELARQAQDLDSLRGRLGLHSRSARDFLDALVALGFLERREGRYCNTPEADVFLDRHKSSYIGGVLEMANHRLYRFWGSLTEALRTGKPQNEAKEGVDFFGALYADPARLREFMKAMTGLSRPASLAIAEKFPWPDYKSFVDVGTAQGDLTVQLALRHGHLIGIGFDLPQVGPIFEDYVQEHRLGDRLRFAAGDFFSDPIPTADVVVMGHVIHDWDLEQKTQLIRKAYEALPERGALVVYDAVIDDERSKNVFALLMSLNMLIETPGGYDYTGTDCREWMRAAGFRETRAEHLAGPDSMVVGVK